MRLGYFDRFGYGAFAVFFVIIALKLCFVSAVQITSALPQQHMLQNIGGVVAVALLTSLGILFLAQATLASIYAYTGHR